MPNLALYVPKPEEFTEAVVILSLVFLVMCGVPLRFKLPMRVTIPAMFLGAMVALAAGAGSSFKSWNTPVDQPTAMLAADLGDYGDMARQWSGTNYSDTFFALTYYLTVESGKLVAFGGMAGALVLCAIMGVLRREAER